jgi:hypothetical protein
MYDRAKVYIYTHQWSLFWIKKVICLPHVSSILKNSVLKLLDTVFAQKKIFCPHYVPEVKIYCSRGSCLHQYAYISICLWGMEPGPPSGEFGDYPPKPQPARNSQNELAICNGGGPSSAFLFERTWLHYELIIFCTWLKICLANVALTYMKP